MRLIKTIKGYRVGVQTLLLFFIFNPVVTNASGNNIIARVVFLRGDVKAISQFDGKERQLRRDAVVYKKDIIKVGLKGLLQIIFTDKTLLYLKANTRIKLSEYLYNPDKTKNNNALTELLKGSMRSITGLIGKKNPEQIKFKNKVATIGIRGTAIELKVNSVTFDFGKGYMETGGGSLNLVEGESARVSDTHDTPAKYFELRSDSDPAVLSRVLSEAGPAKITNAIGSLCGSLPLEAAVLLTGMESQVKGFNTRILTSTVKGLSDCLDKNEMQILLTAAVMIYPERAADILKAVIQGKNKMNVSEALKAILKGMVKPPRYLVEEILNTAIVYGPLNKKGAEKTLREMQDQGYCI